MNRKVATGLVATTLVAGLSACTSSGSSGPTKGASGSGSPTRPSSSASTLVQPSNVPNAVPNSPALRSSVTLTACAATKGGWQAGGMVKNSKSKTAKYQITVFFTTAKSTVIGFGDTTVRLGGGKSAKWSVAEKFPAQKDTRCVLRGVGAPKS